MADYYLKGIDDQTWKWFKALCAQEGHTVKHKLITYIESQANIWSGAEIKERYFREHRKRGGKKT